MDFRTFPELGAMGVEQSGPGLRITGFPVVLVSGVSSGISGSVRWYLVISWACCHGLVAFVLWDTLELMPGPYSQGLSLYEFSHEGNWMLS